MRDSDNLETALHLAHLPSLGRRGDLSIWVCLWGSGRAKEDDPTRLIECPRCDRTVPFHHLRRLPSAAGIAGEDLTEKHVACATCLGEQTLDGHFVYEWWILIGRFCTSFERCSAYLASFIVTYRKKTAQNPADVDVTAGRLVRAARELLEADGRELGAQLDRIARFEALTKRRNQIALELALCLVLTMPNDHILRR